MSGKSIRFSIYSIILFVGAVLGIIYIFKFNFLMGLVGIVLLFVPAYVQRKALGEASGKFDTILAKYIVPALAIVITLLAIMSLAIWIQ